MPSPENPSRQTEICQLRSGEGDKLTFVFLKCTISLFYKQTEVFMLNKASETAEKTYSAFDLYLLSLRAGLLDFQTWINNIHLYGSKSYIMDLEYEGDYQSDDYYFDPDNRQFCRGFCVRKGVVTVYETCDVNHLMDYFERKLGKYSWFETRRDFERLKQEGRCIETPTLPGNYQSFLADGYKILGKWGVNEAIDVIPFILNDDGTISVKVIEKIDAYNPEKKQRATLGGIIDNMESVIEKCLAELLEEYYSNDLFAPESKTMFAAQKMHAETNNSVAEAMTQCLEGTSFALSGLTDAEFNYIYTKIPSLLERAKDGDHKRVPFFLKDALHIQSALAANASDNVCRSIAKKIVLNTDFRFLESVFDKHKKIFMSNKAFPEKMATFKRALDGYVNKELPISGAKSFRPSQYDIDHAFTRFKCTLYMYLFPEKYKSFLSFWRTRLHSLGFVTSYADVRNTNLSYMKTNPHWLLINKGHIDSLEREWLIQAKGGDDALTAKNVKLEDLYKDQMFACHSALILEAMADMCSISPELLDNPNLQKQIAAVEANIKKREAIQQNLVFNSAGKPTSLSSVVISGQNQKQFPVMSTSSDIAQLNNATGSNDFQMVDCVQEAREKLLRLLGNTRFTRMEVKLENLLLPLSTLISIADNAELKEKYIIVDNSSSMDDSLIISEEDGSTTRKTRWQEAEFRTLEQILFAAESGNKVKLGFINDHTFAVPEKNRRTVKAGEYIEFDFSVKRDKQGQILSSDINQLETALNNAITTVTAVFRAKPSGSTYLYPSIEPIIRASECDDERRAIVFSTDGDINDRAKVVDSLKNATTVSVDVRRTKPHLTPLVVSACIEDSRSVTWADNLQNNLFHYVTMRGDYASELKKFRANHGFLIPFNRSTWRALHTLLPKAPGDLLYNKGLFLYPKAINDKTALHRDEISQMMGYEIDDEQYDEYLGYRARVHKEEKSVSESVFMAMPSAPPMPPSAPPMPSAPLALPPRVSGAGVFSSSRSKGAPPPESSSGPSLPAISGFFENQYNS